MTPRRVPPTASRRARLLGTLALVALVPGAALAGGGVAEQDPGPGVLVVDRAGVPVPGLSLAAVDRLAGTSAAARLPRGDRTDEDGWLRWPAGDAPEALDLRSADPEWAVSYVHAARALEEGPGGIERAATIDFSRPAVCVVEPTGTVVIEVVGGKADDRFHATWTDARPEPASHRRTHASATFTGPRGSLRARAGRGTLYLTREGHLGATALTGGAPLLVSVSAGEASRVRVRLEDGPPTTFLAPFDTIQFSRLQALAPDGELVVADVPFEASPLRLPSVVPVSVGGEAAGQPGARPRLPKHLMRAVDAPGALSSLGGARSGTGGTRPGVERAPVLVVFPVDLGGKLRFPEVEQGWIRLAQQGNQFLTSQPFWVLPGAVPLRSEPGRADLGQVLPGRAAGAPSAQVTAVDSQGAAAAHREVLVMGGRLPAYRAITDARGRLEVLGAVTGEVTVASMDRPADRTVATPGGSPATLVIGAGSGVVRGVLRGPAAAGTVLVLAPEGGAAALPRTIGTAGTPVAIADADGRFHFGPLAGGEYRLEASGVRARTVRVVPGETVELALEPDAGASEPRR